MPEGNGNGELLFAALALDEGRTEQAISYLRAALERIKVVRGVPVVQRRLGQLIGGDDGAALIAQAETALRAMRIADLRVATLLRTPLAWAG